jgi:hypothetical protein
MIDLDPKFRTWVVGREKNPKLRWNLLDQQNCRYPYSDQIRIQKQLIDNIDYIKDQRVLDLACHLGIFGDACMQLGAKSVTGTNIRPRIIDIVNQGFQHAGWLDRAKVIDQDIYNIKALQHLCNHHDVVLLAGIMYHVNNHFDILTTISNSTCNRLIIDTLYYLPDWYETQPRVTWYSESNQPEFNGHDLKTASTNTAFVGIPNFCWYQQALELLGWHIRSTAHVKFMHFHTKLRRRAVITACR